MSELRGPGAPPHSSPRITHAKTSNFQIVLLSNQHQATLNGLLNVDQRQAAFRPTLNLQNHLVKTCLLIISRN